MPSSRLEPLPTPSRVLTIGAHPDDAEFGAGGTLARWTAEGAAAFMLVVTDGSKGSWDPGEDPARLVEVRHREQRVAADALGVEEVIFLDHPDGELEGGMDLRRELCLWVRRLRPQVVLSHDPWRRYVLHPDHRATGWGAIDGVVAARDHLFFVDQLVDGLEAHRPEWILLWHADEPDHWEDVSGTLERKIEALLAHSSQGPSTLGDAHEGGERLEDFRRRIAEAAAEAGRPARLEAAEAFKRIQA